MKKCDKNVMKNGEVKCYLHKPEKLKHVTTEITGTNRLE